MSRAAKRARKVTPVDTLSVSSRKALSNRIVNELSQTNSLQNSLELYFQHVGTLGSGTYGKVEDFLCRQTLDSVAVKQVKVHADCPDLANDTDTTMLVLAEGKLLLFLSKHMSCHSPHFIDAYGFELYRKKAHGPQAKFTLVMQTGQSNLHKMLPEWNNEANSSKLLGVVIQTLWGIAAMRKLGISHNDLGTANVLIDYCAENASIKHDSGVALCTHGVVAKICDFGMATQHEYWHDETASAELSEDNMISSSGRCDPRSKHGSIYGYLFENEDRNPSNCKPMSLDGIPENYNIVDSGKALLHPVYYKQLTDDNRDFVYFCNLVYTYISDEGVQPVAHYIKAILKRSNESIPVVVKQVTTPTFICKYHRIIDLFDNMESNTTSYTLPTNAEADALRNLLNAELRATPILDQIYSN